MDMIKKAIEPETLDKLRKELMEPAEAKNRHDRRAADAVARKIEEREKVLRVLAGGSREG